MPKLEEITHLFEPPFSPFILQEANEKIQVWSCIWEEKDRMKKARMVAVTARDVCDKSGYPVIHRSLQILTTQPVSTASVE